MSSFHVSVPKQTFGGVGSNPTDVHLPQFERTGGNTVCVPITTVVPVDALDALDLPESLDANAVERLLEYARR